MPLKIIQMSNFGSDLIVLYCKALAETEHNSIKQLRKIREHGKRNQQKIKNIWSKSQNDGNIQ